MMNQTAPLSGRYRLIQLLGEGGMGSVYKARDETLQRDVAVKTMHPHFARMDEFRTRFLLEARTAARLNHPAVVQVYDFGQQGETLYIVMEFIPGANLAKMLADLRAKNSWVRLDEAIAITHQVSQALDYAHHQGVLHRDIKPANIMLKPVSGEAMPFRPVVTDLGLARLLEGAHITQEGTSIGTPAYMSPEQAMGEHMDGRSDVYSLGVLFYELAVGQLPFPARSISEAIHYHVKTPLPRPSVLRPDLPPAIEEILVRALAKSPTERFASAADFANALEGVAKEITVSKAGRQTPAPGRPDADLATVYQTSIENARGASVVADMPQPDEASRKQDSIQVWYTNNQSRLVPVTKNELIIGRSPDNDIALEDTQISRKHVRVICDGKTYQVIDLNSSNGTFLGGVRLLPGVPEIWQPDKILQMGKVYLRLILANETTQSRINVATYANAGPIGPSAGSKTGASQLQGRIGLEIEETRINVHPGSKTRLGVRVLNQGPIVDKVRISLEGLPHNWIEPAAPIQIMPGEQKIVYLGIQPPLTPESLAGARQARVRAVSQAVPDQLVEIPLHLEVGTFTRWRSDLRPQRVRANRTGLIEIENQGNQAANFTLNLSDRADEVVFQPGNAVLQVPPGARGTLSFKGNRRSRKLIGGESVLPFSVNVRPADGDPQLLSGELVSRALLPLWLLSLVVLACLALMSAAGFYIQQTQQQIAHSTQTAVSVATLVAIRAETFAVGTQSAQSIQQTQTAWPGADDDGDGLSNAQEVSLGTNPEIPDSDGDGLNDGAEVNQYKSNPNIQDSDGDTLTDGVEVNQMHTDPNNRDTDGDSLFDNVDPDPLSSITLTPTPTLHPTITPTPQPLTIADTNADEDNPPIYTRHIKYPTFSGNPQPVADRLNEAVNELVLRQIDSFNQTVNEIPVDSGFPPHDLSMGYQVFQKAGQYVSIHFDVYVFISGAAHPNSYSDALTFDLSQNKVMELGDLFKPGANYLSIISQKCIARLQEKGITGGESGAAPNAENYQNWNWTESGLMITFDPYQVASYAEGTQQITIPWNELSDILR